LISAKHPPDIFKSGKRKEQARSYKMQGLRLGRALRYRLVLSGATEPTADTPSASVLLKRQDFAEICVGALRNGLGGVEGAGALAGEGLPGVQSYSQACTATSSK